MFEVSTERFKIVPLNEYNLELSIINFNKMEKSLGLTVTDKNIGFREKNVFKIRLNDVKNNNSKYMWYTTWIVILKSENRIIGHIMLKGYPNEQGEVNIGYYMQEHYREKGYMSEAINKLIRWIFSNSDVKYIVADTLKTNTTSQNLLKKIGMKLYKEDDECFWWRLKNYNQS
ncbi:MAG: GNAT family N-acetyltransferase [Paraclostridium bifermentans]|uniref:GNAT family N-acetyltransferase n=1 Tax=Paraclostridium bifermentans TaxID=1490 RepID=UPI0011DE42E0|nr:GNAT family N-acetyltransferase [Paraclostridium bifermentans]MBS6509295.1 GNAT family N-acetyltransferase [Paraclostridium bifermentans]MDU3803499.1 GNAT family N-acetyltransferase [Paraclostridium bifermentans]